MRILVTDGMDKTAMAQLREAGHVSSSSSMLRKNWAQPCVSLTQSSFAPRPRFARTTSMKPRAAS